MSVRITAAVHQMTKRPFGSMASALRSPSGLMRLGLPVLLACMPAASAQTPGNPQHGRVLAATLCADCHRTEPGPGSSPLNTAPPFASVAKTKGMNAMALNVWLVTSHPTMPNILLAPDTADDIIAYILTLRPTTRLSPASFGRDPKCLLPRNPTARQPKEPAS